MHLSLLQICDLRVHSGLNLLLNEVSTSLFSPEVSTEHYISVTVELLHTLDKRVFLLLVVHVQIFADSILVVPVVLFREQGVVHRPDSAFSPQDIVR